MKRAAALLPVLLAAAPAAADSFERALLHCRAEAPRAEASACREAVRLGPDHAEAHRLYGLALLLDGAYPAALAAYRRAAHLAPEDAEAHYDLAVAYGALDRFEEAEAPLLRTLALAPGHRQARQVAVLLYQRLGRTAEAAPYVLSLAADGDALAMFEAASHLEHGIGLPADPAGARRWLERAAATGHVGAMQRLADAHLDGRLGLSPDEAEALRWAERARAARARR